MVDIDTYDPSSRKTEVKRIHRDFRQSEKPLASEVVRKIALRNFDFKTPRTFLCPIDGGLGDTVIAVESFMALRAHPAFAHREHFEWVGVMADAAKRLYSGLLSHLEVFDRLLSLSEYDRIDLTHPFELLDAAKGSTRISAHVALGSAWDYLWASWGVPGTFRLDDDSERHRALRRALRSAYRDLRRERALPAPGAYVVLNPEALSASALKSWPKAGWRSLIARIVEETALHVVVSSTHKFFRQVVGKVDRCHHLSPLEDPGLVDDIQPIAALLSQARALVSVDSGPAHLAGMLKTPCIALWGPTTPQIYGHRNNTNLRVSSCPACWTSPRKFLCAENICMKEIPPDLIWSLLESEIRARGAEEHR